MELHLMIATYLDRKDLRSYRFSGRTAAKVGAEILFRVLAFNAASEVLNQVTAVAKDEYRSHVRSLLWDTNLWNLYFHPEPDTLGKFLSYLMGNTTRLRAYIIERPWERPPIPGIESWNPNSDVTLKEAHSIYLARIEDEEEVLKGALNHKNFALLSDQFPSLKKCYIINGDFSFDQKVRKSHFQCGPPTESKLYSRSELLHYRTLRNTYTGPGVDAFWTVLLAAHKFEKLRVDALDWRAFEHPSEIYERTDPSARMEKLLLTEYNFFAQSGRPTTDKPHLFAHLTSLHLTLTSFKAQRDHSRDGLVELGLQNFLSGLQSLKSLSLNLEKLKHSYDDSRLSNLSDAVPPNHIWPHLCKLSLSYFTAEGEFLTDLLWRHADTLEDLRFADIGLGDGIDESDSGHEDQDKISAHGPSLDWPAILYQMPLRLFLKRARFQGDLSQNVGSEFDGDGWDMEANGLGKELAKYIVKGGLCPVTVENSFSMGRLLSDD
jgi:hypothetical protein